MKKLGYQGLFIPRNTTLYCEGEATFYRTSRFSFEESSGIVLQELIDKAVDTSTAFNDATKSLLKDALSTFAVAMLIRLKSVSNEQDVVTIGNIHVAYDKLVRPDRRCVQLMEAMKQLVQLAGRPDRPHVLCGDFNSCPDTAPYQLMADGFLNENSMNELQGLNVVELPDGKKDSVVSLFPQGFNSSSSSFMKSSYKTVAKVEPLTSRFAFDGKLRTVDYIWYSSLSLDVASVVDVVDPSLIEPGVPSAIFPSDHLSLKSTFVFKND
jgi:CCR4-NOT transcription complex subunit 6